MTHIDLNADVISQIIQAYFPDRSVLNFEPVSGGLINQTFRVQLDHNELFILQRMNRDIFKDIDAIHRNIRVVAEHLDRAEYRYRFPTPLKNTAIQTWIELGDSTWRLLPFVKDTYSTGKAVSGDMAFNAGKCLGHFHASTIGLDPCKLAKTIPDFHAGVLRVNQFENAVWESDQTGIKLVGEIYKHLHILQDWDDICSEAPTRIVHFDAKIENFLFKSGTDKVAALIDLDTIMPGSILSDVGDMIRSFCDEELKFRDVLTEGYLSEMKPHLTEHESNFLKFSGSAITLMQAVRFLTDYLNGDVYYQTEYEGQNLERAEKQFALYLQLHS